LRAAARRRGCCCGCGSGVRWEAGARFWGCSSSAVRRRRRSSRYLATNAVRSSSLACCQASIRLGCGGGGAEGTPSCVSAGATGSGGVCSGCNGETPTCGMPICDCIADVGAAASAVSAPPFAEGATEAAGAGLRAEPEAAGAFALAAVPIRSVRMVNCFPPRVTLRVCLGGASVSCGGASSWRTVRTRNSDTRHWRAISRLLHTCHSGSASISSIACRRSRSVRR
jgi:hypothetical protein